MRPVYLKHLLVEGFKSFPEPSGLELHPGVCVFVGANGTGKSNLTDALTWALGENDMGDLRCRSEADLVFAGSDELLPLDSSEVTIVLDHRPERLELQGLPPEVCKHGHASNHTRDVPEGTLTITRRARRGEDTHYLLDGAEASQADVAARLADLGIGPAHVSAIRQGELDRLLLLDPRSRRRLIEEAVGIPELSLRHESLRSERSIVSTRHEHLLAGREAAQERVADLEREARALDRLRALEAEQASLRAEVVRRALSAGAEAGSAEVPPVAELLALLGLPASDPEPARATGGEAAPERAPGADGAPTTAATGWDELCSGLGVCAARLKALGPALSLIHISEPTRPY